MFCSVRFFFPKTEKTERIRLRKFPRVEGPNFSTRETCSDRNYDIYLIERHKIPFRSKSVEMKRKEARKKSVILCCATSQLLDFIIKIFNLFFSGYPINLVNKTYLEIKYVSKFFLNHFLMFNLRI